MCGTHLLLLVLHTIELVDARSECGRITTHGDLQALPAEKNAIPMSVIAPNVHFAYPTHKKEFMPVRRDSGLCAVARTDGTPVYRSTWSAR